MINLYMIFFSTYMDNVNISPLFTNDSIQEKKEKAIAKENKELSTSLKNQEEDPRRLRVASDRGRDLRTTHTPPPRRLRLERPGDEDRIREEAPHRPPLSVDLWRDRPLTQRAPAVQGGLRPASRAPRAVAPKCGGVRVR